MEREEKIMCRVSFSAEPARCADDLGVWLFIYSCCMLFVFSFPADQIEREKCKCDFGKGVFGILTGRETLCVSRLNTIQVHNAAIADA